MKKIILEYPSSSGIKIYTRPNGSYVVRIPVSITKVFAERKTLRTLTKAKEYAENQYNKFKISDRGLKGISEETMSEIQKALKNCAAADVSLTDAVDFALLRMNKEKMNDTTLY
tara:strand:+ start:21 stop:362 length:342 start_codon:yes stop_codon:yes gene_type:complete